jgi:hypothetical protein
MEQKPYAAFGYLLLEQSFQDGETYLAEVTSDPGAIHFWVEGRFRNFDKTRNAAMPDLVAGQLLLSSDYYAGLFEHTAVGNTRIMCVNRALNRGFIPDVSKFELPGGSETVLPKGTKLFLCAGTLAVGGQNVSKPTQIRVTSDNSLVQAVTDCYGLVFP